jgi:protein-S-isoprenylcysteine O-methyltransferase Ste14
LTGRGRATALAVTAGPLAAGAGVLLCGLYAPTPDLLPGETAVPLGYFLAFAGIILLLYALAHPLERQLGPEGQGVRKTLRMGPYAVIRQPIPLAILTAFAGSALTRQSLPAALGTLLVLAPLLLWRARLQERNLADRYGERWESYASSTGFILPVVLPSKRPPQPPPGD